MGRVHEAWDPILRRVVAIKLLHGSDPELMLRFLQEAQHQARLEHPNICRILDMGQWEGRPYIAMQRIHGRSLSELRPDLGVMDLARILVEVAGAIHAAHRSALIHRDIKPSNILVERDANGSLHPFVVDFGLARDLLAPDLTLSWAAIGTPAFMSPEQARCETLTPAADIYSLGATLYAMLSGHPPFESATLAGLLSQQSRSGVRSVRRLNPKVPRDLETITLKCLEEDPQRRYASAFSLEEDLRRFLAGEPIHARPAGPLGRAWRWSKRRPALSITLASSLAAVTLLGAWNLQTLRRARLREQLAQRFALEIRDAEHLLRIERMMPRHDIRPAEARLKARMTAIQAEMERLGGIAKGPGHYALGRGWMSLRAFEAAQKELETAWQVGFHAPEVAYGIGLAQLKRFEERRYRLLAGDGFEPAKAELHRELVLPALEWMTRADGAKVDNPKYGRALAAWGSDQYEEADQLFAQALEQAPWLVEAWVSRAKCLIMRPPPGGTTQSTHAAEMVRRAEAFLPQAALLAPSDESLPQTLGELALSKSALNSAHHERSEAPILRAKLLLDQALEIHPDRSHLASLACSATLQLGFHQLATGRDPGPMASEKARTMEVLLKDPAWGGALDRVYASGNTFLLWWVALEADFRYGRDPREALAQAEKWRKAMAPNAHHAFPMLIEAAWRQGQGQNPDALYHQAQSLLKGLLAEKEAKSAFVHCILGQGLLAQAEWDSMRGRTRTLILSQAIQALQKSVELDPGFAYAYYHLPRAQALLARVQRKAGRDSNAILRAALDSASKGLAINPRNAQLQLAAAEAYLAQALCQGERGQYWIGRAHAALDASEAINPSSFEAKRLRAEVALEAAQREADAGRSANSHLSCAEKACRQGSAIKGDEPRFRILLARITALKNGTPISTASPIAQD